MEHPTVSIPQTASTELPPESPRASSNLLHVRTKLSLDPLAVDMSRPNAGRVDNMNVHTASPGCTGAPVVDTMASLQGQHGQAVASGATAQGSGGKAMGTAAGPQESADWASGPVEGKGDPCTVEAGTLLNLGLPCAVGTDRLANMGAPCTAKTDSVVSMGDHRTVKADRVASRGVPCTVEGGSVVSIWKPCTAKPDSEVSTGDPGTVKAGLVSDLLEAVQRAQSRARSAEEAVDRVEALLSQIAREAAAAQDSARASLEQLARAQDGQRLRSPVLTQLSVHPAQLPCDRAQDPRVPAQIRLHPAQQGVPVQAWTSALLHAMKTAEMQRHVVQALQSALRLGHSEGWGCPPSKAHKSHAGPTGIGLSAFSSMPLPPSSLPRPLVCIPEHGLRPSQGRPYPAPADGACQGPVHKGDQHCSSTGHAQTQPHSWAQAEAQAETQTQATGRERRLEAALWHTTVQLRRCEHELAQYRHRHVLAERKGAFVPNSHASCGSRANRPHEGCKQAMGTPNEGHMQRGSKKTKGAPKGRQTEQGLHCSRRQDQRHGSSRRLHAEGSALFKGSTKSKSSLLLTQQRMSKEELPSRGILALIVCSIRNLLGWALMDHDVEHGGLNGGPATETCHLSIIVELVLAAHEDQF